MITYNLKTRSIAVMKDVLWNMKEYERISERTMDCFVYRVIDGEFRTMKELIIAIEWSEKNEIN